MASEYPVFNDNEVDLIRKIVNNTALLDDMEAGDVASVKGTTGNVLVNGDLAVHTGALTLSLPTALTSINSLTSVAGVNLTLGTGTSGTALTFASATNIATFAAAVLHPDGTAAAPSVAGTNFTTTGLFWDATALNITAAGVLTGRFSSTAGIALTALGTNQSITLTPSGTGQVLTIAGTVALPSYSFTGDPNTGIFNVGADRLAFSTAGAQRGEFSLAGNLLLGGTTDGTGNLQAFGSAAGNGIIASFQNSGGNSGIELLGTAKTAYIVGDTGGAFRVYTNGTVGVVGTQAALFDASQNTTLAGNLTVSGSNVGVGGAVATSTGIYITSAGLATTTQHGLLSAPAYTSAATSFGAALRVAHSTAASAFTMTDAYGITIAAVSIGAGSAVTTSTGVRVENQGATGITNAYGIDIAAQSGAATVNIGLRNAGTTTLTGNVTLGAAYIGSTQALTGAGAVSVVKITTKVTTDGVGNALTLADGTDGQIVRVVLDVLGGGGQTAILTPTTKTGFTTVTFDAAGDTVSLQFVTTRGWMVIGSFNVVIA